MRKLPEPKKKGKIVRTTPSLMLIVDFVGGAWISRSDSWDSSRTSSEAGCEFGALPRRLLQACKRCEGALSRSRSCLKVEQKVFFAIAGPDPDCVPILRFLVMNLERVNEERSEELSLPLGSILLSQMEYVIEVLMKFEPSLQLRTRKFPGVTLRLGTSPPLTEVSQALRARNAEKV